VKSYFTGAHGREETLHKSFFLPHQKICNYFVCTALVCPLDFSTHLRICTSIDQELPHTDGSADWVGPIWQNGPSAPTFDLFRILKSGVVASNKRVSYLLVAYQLKFTSEEDEIRKSDKELATSFLDTAFKEHAKVIKTLETLRKSNPNCNIDMVFIFMTNWSVTTKLLPTKDLPADTIVYVQENITNFVSKPLASLLFRPQLKKTNKK